MRFVSFILAFAFVLAGSSMAGAVDGNLPHIGSFTFDGLAGHVPQAATIVAALR